MLTRITTLISLGLVLLLTGCGEENNAIKSNNGKGKDSSNLIAYDIPGVSDDSPLGKILDFKVITDVTEDSILVDDVYYEITENTLLVNSNNEKLTIKNLRAGDLIKLHSTGNIDKNTYPGKSVAKIVKLQTDKESILVSKAIRHYIENREGGLMAGTWIYGIGKELIHLRFYDTAVEKQYEAAINYVTNETSEREITSIAQLKERGTDGTTAGHITEIYENGFRVGLVDYTLSDDAVLVTDSGEALTLDALQIGELVEIDYRQHKGDKIIKEAIASKLTVLKVEEIPDVQEWIKSVLEGPLYKDPVIMFNYVGPDHNSYTIQIPDLKDDTWDTFKVTYFLASKEHRVERIEHIPPNQPPTPYDKIKQYGVVQGIDDDQIFMHNKYEFLNEDLLVNPDGEKLTLKDVKVGSLIEFEYSRKSIEERGILKKIILHDDELSKDISSSIRHFIKHQQLGAIHSLYIYSIDDKQILLKLRIGQKEPQFKAVIDRNTNDFKVEEDPVY